VWYRSEKSYISVLGLSILHFSMIFLFDFRTVGVSQCGIFVFSVYDLCNVVVRKFVVRLLTQRFSTCTNTMLSLIFLYVSYPPSNVQNPTNTLSLSTRNISPEGISTIRITQSFSEYRMPVKHRHEFL